MNQQRFYSKLFVYTVLLFAAAACVVLYANESSSKSIIRGSNLRRVQVTERHLKAQTRALEEDEEEDGDDDADLESDSEDEADKEESAKKDAGGASNSKGASKAASDAGDKDDSDSDEGDDDSESDEGETPKDAGEDKATTGSSKAGDGKKKDGNGNQGKGDDDSESDEGKTPKDSGGDKATTGSSKAGDAKKKDGNGNKGNKPIPADSSPATTVTPATPQQGSGVSGGAQGDSTQQGGATQGTPVFSTSPNKQDEETPTIGFPADPNSPTTQFGDTPFLGQGGSDWTTTTPPIGVMDSWITPMEPTDELPGDFPPMNNVGGQGGNTNQPGFPSGGNGYATPANGQFGFDNTSSSSFNTQYTNSQTFGNNGGQTKKKGGGLADAWKNLKNQSTELGKSSLGEEVKLEEEAEEEEVADETEGCDDDQVPSKQKASGSKPQDTDDEFEKMIEDAEGKTSKTNKEKVGEDLEAEENEEVAEEELEEVEEELKEEEEVAAAAGGMGFILAIFGMIFTAHQMSENPDGVYASVCRLAITISGVVVKIICMPCRKVIGHGNPHYGTHMRISTSADYGLGGANAGFELS